MAVYAVVCVAIGALVCNQVAYIVAVLAWMTAVEHMIFPAYMSVGRWLPGPASYVVLQLGPSADPDGKLFSPTVSGLLISAYAIVALALAVRLTPKRDVL